MSTAPEISMCHCGIVFSAELDFTAVSTTLNFSRNAKFKSFDVPILVDNIAELREDFLLSVSIPSTLVRRDKVQILSNHERSRIGVISGSVRISDDDSKLLIAV